MVHTASLEGQVAIVTGGAQGIGGACATALAEVGASVLVVDLASPLHDMPGPEAKAAEITRAGGVAEAFEADVTERSDIEAMIARAVELWGRLDVLINNANGSLPGLKFGGVVDCDEAAWHYQIQISITAIFRAAKLAVPIMAKTGGGRIVNMSSVHGVLAATNSVAYETVKTAIIGMTKQIATDVGKQGITCNCICPGLIIHQRNAHKSSDDAAFDARMYPVRRFGAPEDIAYMARFLWSKTK